MIRERIFWMIIIGVMFLTVWFGSKFLASWLDGFFTSVGLFLSRDILTVASGFLILFLFSAVIFVKGIIEANAIYEREERKIRE